MRVILKQRVDNLGDKDEVVDASPGYARNYLIAQGLAKLATPADIVQSNLRQTKAAADKKKKDADLNELTDKLKKIEITVAAKANPAGRLFGSVDDNDVRQLLEKIHKVKLPTDVRLDGNPIKQVGTSQMRWHLPGGRSLAVTVRVTDKADG